VALESVVIGRLLVGRPDGSLGLTAAARLDCADGRIVRIRSGSGRAAREAGSSGSDPPTVGNPESVLLPGLSDSHLHLIACAADRATLDLARDRPRSIDDLLERIAAAATTLAAGEWLRASGYDEAWLAERRHPTRAELDRVVSRNPLRVRHATRHGSLLNSKAWAIVARQSGMPDRSGDSMMHGREPELTRLVGPADASALAAGFDALGRELLASGVVSVEDLGAANDRDRIATLAAAVDAGFPQRVRAYVRDADELESAVRASRGRVEVVGVKLLARSTDEAGRATFRDAVVRARRRGLPLAVHAVEPDVVASVLDVLERAPARAAARPAGESVAGAISSYRQVSTPVPDRIEHASLCPPELVKRIARAGLAVVTQPGFLVERGDKYRREVEEPLWGWLYPLRALRAAGVLVVGSSDAPVARPDARLGLAGATLRRTGTGTVLAPDERLSDRAALELFTSAAAALRGEEGRSGVLAEGARADIVVAGRHPADGGWAELPMRAAIAGGVIHVLAGASA
jgi:hypothetical protein